MDRETEYKRRKEQRAARRAQGLCTRCGVPLEKSEKACGFITCQRCRDKWRLDYYPNSAKALKSRPQGDRGKNHDCWLCGQKLPEGYTKKKCAECIEKSRQTLLAHNREKRMKYLEDMFE